MKSLKRELTIFVFVVLAALSLGVLQLYSQQWIKPAEEEEEGDVNYPVILVHGLGEKPGAEAFGNLADYLEAFYFDVEIMDFNEFAKHPLVNDKDKGNLGTLAAILGKKIKQTLKDYDVSKVNIVAHSYGGLIVQAYLMNYGEEYDKKSGAFEYDVNKVYYAQVPFYGSDADLDYLTQLAEETDYGPFTNPNKMVETLQIGSEELYNLDYALRIGNPYISYVDAMTAVSVSDEVVPRIMGTLVGTLDARSPYPRFRVFNVYVHSSNELSSANRKDTSLTYVKDITDPGCVSILSFLDDGVRWRRIGSMNIDNAGLVMVKYEKAAGANKITKDQVKLLPLKKAGVGRESEVSSPKSEIKAHFNEKGRIFTFTNVTPGNYKFLIKGRGKTVTEITQFGIRPQRNYVFSPKKNELQAAGLEGLFALTMLTLQGTGETASYPLNGLNPGAFEIEFFLEGANMDNFDKGIVVGLYNSKGNMNNPGNNGSRLEIVVRGEGNHRGKIHVNLNIDKNKNGNIDYGEMYETKSDLAGFNWFIKNKIRFRITTTVAGDYHLLVWVNDILALDRENPGPYYNPSPVLSFGGKFHDAYNLAPSGAKITNFVIRNL